MSFNTPVITTYCTALRKCTMEEVHNWNAPSNASRFGHYLNPTEG